MLYVSLYSRLLVYLLVYTTLFQNEGTIFVLGVSLFFCSSRDSCFHFVCGGGMDQIIKLLCCETQRSMAITLLLLRVVEAATRYGIGCEGFWVGGHVKMQWFRLAIVAVIATY